MRRTWGMALVIAACGIACSSFNGSDPAGPGDNSDGGPSEAGDENFVTGTQTDDSFELLAPTAKVVVLQGGTQTVTLSVTRGADVNGAIDFAFKNLPDGITTKDTTLAPGANQLDVELDADLLATQTTAKVMVVGTSTSADGTVVVRSASFDLLLRGAAGSLDTTFGTNGQLAIDATANVFDSFLVLGPHDEIYTYSTSDPTCQGQPFCLERFTADGAVDTTFGMMGKAPAPRTEAGAVLPDNRFVGGASLSGRPCVVYRLLPNGSMDTAFGPNGDGTSSLTVSGGSASPAENVALDADGSIAIAFKVGSKIEGVGRLDANGIASAAFGQLGEPGYEFWSPNTFLVLTPALAVKKSHEVIAGVADESMPGSPSWHAIEYDISGRRSSGFGTNGEQTGGLDGLDDISMAYGGTVLFSDESFLFSAGASLVKLTPSGQLDAGFGGTGHGQLYMPTFVYAVARTPDDKIVTVTSPFATGGAMIVTRLDAKGNADPSFGGAGTVTLTGLIESHARLAVQSDGRILAMGKQVIYRLWD